MDHPKTDVMMLEPTKRKYDSGFYGKQKLSNFVAGIVSMGKAKAYPYSELKKQPLVSDEFNGQPIVIWFEEQSGAVWMFNRKLDDQQLTFEFRNGKVIDQQSGSTWNLRKGVAVDGKLKGKLLSPVVAIPSFKKAWKAFHPDSKYWSAKSK